jgi:predicted metal-dependent enzyme (double-stranded beta helix superfamily)/SAM-dependent methyltransferase
MNDVLTLPESLKKIVNQLETANKLSPSHIEKVVRKANVKPDDLDEWSDFDHPSKDGYGRKLIASGDNYEVMVMSWKPGDFSAIHDHGYTMWGAVQIFGQAEHATFQIEGNEIVTQARWETEYGDTVPVTHELIHQMGNTSSDKSFVSLHVYGTKEPVSSVTGEARIFIPEESSIQRVNGGVFFGLGGDEVVRTEPGPVSADFTTGLRNQAEALNQFIKTNGVSEVTRHPLREKIYALDHKDELVETIAKLVDPSTDQVIKPREWKTLNLDFKALARLQEVIKSTERGGDRFGNYAPLYDALIGEASLPFMKNYLGYAETQTGKKWSDSSVLSIGCGTGLVESWLIQHYGLAYDQLMGVDISSSMVEEAAKRINAVEANFLDWRDERQWDIIMSGLNVYQYIPAKDFEKAIAKTAELLNQGGYFVGDMITPDHIRWYPNVMMSEDRSIISMRTPEIIEEGGIQYQQSDIINVNFRSDEMEVHYAGKHRRHLPSIRQVYDLFSKYFEGEVLLVDALDLTEVNPDDETCQSTRYVVIARN